MTFIIGFATTNPHKLSETQACFRRLIPDVQVVPLPPSQEVEETGRTFEANALLKLEAAIRQPLPAEITHVIAEDAGLIVDALDGYSGLSPFPGIRSDRWLTPEVQQALWGHAVEPLTYQEKNQALLQLMQDQANRNARYEASVACWTRQTGDIFVETGTVPLQVALAPRGENGFGYDPIMIPMAFDPTRTMAELTSEEKNAISHRFQALDRVARALQGVLR